MKQFIKVQNKHSKRKGVAQYHIDGNGNFVACGGVYIALMAWKTDRYKDSTPFGDTKNTSIGGGVYNTLDDMEKDWDVVA